MSVQTLEKGVYDVAYETKVLLIAIADIIRRSTSLEDVYNTIEKMANAEGVLLEPYVDNSEKKED